MGKIEHFLAISQKKMALFGNLPTLDSLTAAWWRTGVVDLGLLVLWSLLLHIVSDLVTIVTIYSTSSE